MQWKALVEKAGRYEVSVTYSCENRSGGSTFAVACAGQQVTGRVRETGLWTAFQTETLGALALPPGPQSLAVTAVTMPVSAVMNLPSVLLRPL